jgi:3-keto-5-aminohexanoate cleavage enzyme
LLPGPLRGRASRLKLAQPPVGRDTNQKENIVDKLIITVAADCSGSYPKNPYLKLTTDIDHGVSEYIRSANAGAAITHIHGVRFLEKEIQPDGRRVSKLDFDGWQAYMDGIMGGLKPVRPIMQYGIAAARFDERVKLMDQGPDMMSIVFSSHDEYFNSSPEVPPTQVLAIHTRDELRNYCKVAPSKGVKPEIESFTQGAFFNIENMFAEGLLQAPVYTSLFFWPGGNWTPPTFKNLLNTVEHLPKGFKVNWNCCSMQPSSYVHGNRELPGYWEFQTLAIIMGGHIRVGMEDCPFIDDKGTWAKSNAELVEKAVSIAKAVGREVATPDEARAIIGLPARS